MAYDYSSTLNPQKALIVELIRQYFVLGIECKLLEVQKFRVYTMALIIGLLVNVEQKEKIHYLMIKVLG